MPTAKQIKTLLPIITAFANGETIQFKRYRSQQWEDVGYNSSIGFNYEADRYRIKPAPVSRFSVIYKGDAAPWVGSGTFLNLRRAQEVANEVPGNCIAILELIAEDKVVVGSKVHPLR